ncbi:MAG: HEAT repeat domain-containing protein [Deltaproteobacteria bacterium]|nr:HEAT repeat domain-containing protein [Deltaproteobacteria bacterium]
MASGITGGRELRKAILGLLKTSDFDNGLAELMRFPERKSVNALISLLYHTDEIIRWRAVSAIGVVVQRLAWKNREAARVIMRRLMWSLNDESGGIGWGAAEAMGEIMARDDVMASEYASILISYLDEKGNFLEYEVLQRGALWAIARLARERPGLLRNAAGHIPKYLDSRDPAVKGLAALASGLLGVEEARSKLQRMLHDRSSVLVYQEGKVIDRSVGDLVREALDRLNAKIEDRRTSWRS